MRAFSYSLQCILILFSSLLLAEGAHIIVPLPTEETLHPLYCVSPSQLSSYEKSLLEVLRFDLAINGSTRLLPDTAERSSLAQSEEFDALPDRKGWQKEKVAYLLRTHITPERFRVRLYPIREAAPAHELSISLTGELKEDRVRIHELSNGCFSAITGRPGIATTRILYTLTRRQGTHESSEVWLSDYDGGNRHQLTSEGGLCLTPIFFPPQKGKRAGNYLYVSYRTGQPKLYLAHLSTYSPGQSLLPFPGEQQMPAIHRSRNLLALISDRAGNPDLFLTEISEEGIPQGKPYQLFSAPHAAQASPTFSPDGTQIAFVSNMGGAPRIYTLPTDSQKEGTPPRLISRRCRENTGPSWAPDGTKIAYSGRIAGVRQIWIYDCEKEEEYQLTKGPGHKENPCWAPDSCHLIFNGGERGKSDLYIAHLHSSEAVKITDGAGEKRFPCWEPLSLPDN